ncbi:helix-turn-helix transcriptional regulator [Streptomyces sp. NPDC008125]|uniref:helix-turn-helix transcriptional regulator n=1 Tax=Streptomyces sp. NPDC008125 TaxID=3364811 RepID=UPI0036E08E54
MSSDLGTSPRQPLAPASAASERALDTAREADSLRSRFAGLRTELRDADAALTQLLAAWRPGGGATEEFVVVWEGREAQARRLLELEYGARTSLLVFQSGANTVAPVPTTLLDDDGLPDATAEDSDDPPQPAHEPAGEPARKDGNPDVSYRVVVDRAFLSEPAAVRALDERVSAGNEVRVVDQPLLKLVVADGETAMVQLDQGRSLELRPPLVLLATELFESVWRRSRPYLREDGDLSPTDRRILQLMLSGLTDTATAHQLGASPRTIQRRVRALMDVAAVSSRVQLGWYAMRNNWV